MPSHEFSRLGREDLGDLVAFLKTIAPIAREVPPPRVGPTARFLFLRGELPLVAAERIDHDAPLRHGPKPEVTAEYGEYLATGCAGCHGPNLSGGPVPGAPGRWPAASNLTPDPTGLGGWTEEQFTTVLRTGRRPDDRPLNAAYMPWTMTSRMTADELAALWLYFQSLEPVAKGVR
jgi:mono/diheme cytochrome c family protein